MAQGLEIVGVIGATPAAGDDVIHVGGLPTASRAVGVITQVRIPDGAPVGSVATLGGGCPWPGVRVARAVQLTTPAASQRGHGQAPWPDALVMPVLSVGWMTRHPHRAVCSLPKHISRVYTVLNTVSGSPCLNQRK